MEDVRELFAKDQFATGLCGILIEDISVERCTCRMPLTPGHMNAGNVAQGGAVFTLCDIAFSVAANAGGVSTVSLGGQITYVRPGTGAYLRAEATLISSTRSTCLYRVDVWNDQSALVAHATFNGFHKG